MNKTVFNIGLLFISIVAFINCTKEDLNESQLIGTWFLKQSCNDNNEECSDIERGSYSLSFNNENGTVVVEKEGSIFPTYNYEIKNDVVGNHLYVNENRWGRITTLSSHSMVLRSSQTGFLASNVNTKIHYFVR